MQLWLNMCSTDVFNAGTDNAQTWTYKDSILGWPSPSPDKQT